MYKFRLPLGMQDYLPDYLHNKIMVEQRIMRTIKSYAYKQIETPKLESFDVYNSGVGAVPYTKFFKTSDTDGNLLVLRADMTLPISRIVATKFQDDEYPLRFCYLSDSYNLTSEINRSREFTQAGVELYGVSGAEGDAEVIALAIQSLINTGLKDFQIDIGQVNVLKGILDEYKLSEEQKKEIISSVDKKVIIEGGLDKNLASIINKISMLYGDVSVLKEASDIVHNKKSIDALLNLFEVHQILTEYGFDKYISFDLGLVNSFSYYSGIVFKGITKHFGSPILGGGRYDELCHTFNKDIPATGFAIGIKDLLFALENSGYEKEKIIIDLVVGVYDNIKALGSARKIIDNAIKKGLKVDIIYKSSYKKVQSYANKMGIDNAIFINEEGKIEEELS